MQVAIEQQKNDVFEKDESFLATCQLLFTSAEPDSGRIALQIMAVLSGFSIFPPLNNSYLDFYIHANELCFSERELLNVTYFYLNLMLDDDEVVKCHYNCVNTK